MQTPGSEQMTLTEITNVLTDNDGILSESIKQSLNMLSQLESSALNGQSELVRELSKQLVTKHESDLTVMR
jgi:hypothetical protein